MRRECRYLAWTLLLLAALCAGGPAGRVHADGPVRDRLARMLDGVADRVPPGEILYDRVLPLSGAEVFDGSPAAPAASARQWRQLFSEMSRATTGPSAWPGYDDLVAGDRGELEHGVVPLVLLNARYDRIRADALRTGALLVQDGRLVAGAGEPFTAGRAVALAGLRGYTYRGERVTFRLAARDYFTNDPDRPRDLWVDLDDGGGLVPAAFGTDLVTRYDAVGPREIRVRLRLQGGRVLEAAAAFEVRALRTPTPSDTLHLTASIPYGGVHGTGDAYVYLADGHAAITNPVVVLEGFDLDNSMYWDELYALLNREGLLETLRARGYDPVVLNFTDATDYIQRNAFVAEELIQQVRAAIPPSTTIALIGASMGGLVGRYALAYMESHGIPHSTRTFISFDSPQAGADIPLGLQYWIWFFADQSADAAAFLAALDSPASRQMLVYHHTDPPTGTGTPDPLRAQLLADFAAIGNYPTTPRLVAMANGSGLRANQGFNAGDQLVRWEYTSFLVDITGNAWSVPDGGSRTVFHGLIDYLFLPPDETTVTISGTQPYDNAPGGWRNSVEQMGAIDPGYGDIVALTPNHCFIPSVSSLAISGAAPFYDIAGDPNLLLHTPFDAVYYPAANQEHVLVTPENAPWLIGEIDAASSGVSVGASGGAPIARIESPVPSPVGAAADVRFAAPSAGPAALEMFDLAGRRVAVVAAGTFPAGENSVRLDRHGAGGAAIPAGVYFLRLRGDGFAASRKIVVR